MGVFRGGKFDQQSRHWGHPYPLNRDRLAQHRQPIIESEQWLLLIIDRYSHNDFVEKFPRPLDDIDVTVCDRIKTARINRPSHGGTIRRRSSV